MIFSLYYCRKCTEVYFRRELPSYFITLWLSLVPVLQVMWVSVTMAWQNFATSKSLIFKSAMFPLHYIHKYYVGKTQVSSITS